MESVVSKAIHANPPSSNCQESLKCPHKQQNDLHRTVMAPHLCVRLICPCHLSLTITFGLSLPQSAHSRYQEWQIVPSVLQFIVSPLSWPVISLSPLCPYVSLSRGPLKQRCVGPVHLADRHLVAQWEAILPHCEAIVVCNIMDWEVKQRYWFSCWEGWGICKVHVSPNTRVSRRSCSPSLGLM